MIATCFKISNDRFEIDVGYNKKLIDIFKAIPNYKYDPSKKRWNFQLSEYTNLVNMCKTLEPEIKISGLKQNERYGGLANSVSESCSHFKSPSMVLSKILRGKCILKSQDRFEVDVGFDSKLIETFKTISSRNYDITTKRWNFALKEYITLMNLIEVLKPNVIIEGLPSSIFSSFYSPSKHEISKSTLSKKAINSEEKLLQFLQMETSDDFQNSDNNDQKTEIKDDDVFQSIDSHLVSNLFPFQREGVEKGISKHHGKLLLADDMGLGKTIQSLGIMNYYKNDWPLLIVCPSSVRYQWFESIKRWLPSVDALENVHVITEKAVSDDAKLLITPTKNKILITSYDWLARRRSQLNSKNDGSLLSTIRSIILDESHFIKNFKAIRSKAVLSLTKKCRRIILCTGTPALSRPEELYTQISCINKTLFPSFHEFGVRYCNARSTQWGWDYSGSCNMQELQLILEKHLMIRRMKADVLDQLPTKTRTMVLMDLSLSKTDSKSLDYAAKSMQNTQLKGMEKRGALLLYFRESAKVKLQAVINHIVGLLEKDQKIVVFAHHQLMIQGLHECLLKRDINHIIICGKTSSAERNENCEIFQHKSKCKVALLSITAANAGINLTSANLVVFAELFWNPGILVQAEDRAYRIGQEKDVVIQYLVAPNTADDFIWPLVKSKLKVLQGAGLTNEDFSKTSAENSLGTSGGFTQAKITDNWAQFIEDEMLVEECETSLLDSENFTDISPTSPKHTRSKKLKL